MIDYANWHWIKHKTEKSAPENNKDGPDTNSEVDG